MIALQKVRSAALQLVLGFRHTLCMSSPLEKRYACLI